jgi:hypothetical protein
VNQNQKPTLHLFPGTASLEQAQQLIEEMTGEKMTPEEIVECAQRRTS